jgi:hypothetical protein
MRSEYDNKDDGLHIQGDIPFMAVKEYEYIQSVINTHGLKRVLEWGSGSSTLWFPENCNVDEWVAVEHNKADYDYLLPKINKKVSLRLLQDSDDYINVDGEYDLIIIDGIYREECLQKAFQSLSDNPQARIILHDSGRKAYKDWYSKYPHKIIFEGEGWLGDGWDHRGLTEFNNSKVTMIVTTMSKEGRSEELARTLKTFEEYNTYPLAEIIIRDDSVNHVGQIKSVEEMMSQVKTPYVFHCEDDWEFHKHGFIEACLKEIDEENVHSVWIRDEDDFDGYHRVKPTTDGKYVVSIGASHGFSFNPHLYNMKYYDGFEKTGGATPEDSIGVDYTAKGLKAVWLPGYVKHIG